MPAPNTGPASRLLAAPRLGLGCMRLSSAGSPDEEAAAALVRRALDLGVRLLDTADVYAPDADRIGHNERLLARALASWKGPRDEVTVATKGGLVRSGKLWRPDGRAGHLRSACEASLLALGVERIALYQLHAPDPSVPLATSARALARLRREGLVEAVGLCNVNLEQLEEARRHVEVATVQVALHPFDLGALKNGLAPYCRDEGIALLAHSPLGGESGARRLGRDPLLRALATELDRTPQEIALAWLLDLAPNVVALPGATREASLLSSLRAAATVLDQATRRRLDERFPAGRALRGSRRAPPRSSERAVVLLVGAPAAGKTTLARQWQALGFARLNRDERGGRLAGLLPELDALLARGVRGVVLDNTYPTRAARFDVVETAWRHGVPVRCVWLRASLEEVQRRAVERMLQNHGRLLAPAEIATAGRGDPEVFGPDAQLRYFRALEPPRAFEGFVAIEERDAAGAALESAGAPPDCRALFFDYAELVRRPGEIAAARIELLPGRAAALREQAARGVRLFGLSWQPDIGLGKASDEALHAGLARVHELLGVAVEAAYCPHPPGPAACWCRKPLPGLGAALVHRHRLDAAVCALVARSAVDHSWARRMGFRYVDAEAFFGA